ncbi:MAG: cytochrome c biogenesis protein CcsA [Bacteroidia bacterium]|nr:cytochrome c biogenesis protein CcsA [Bacteroidia bacterium]
MSKLNWWKYLTIGLMLYTLVGGILIKVPVNVGMLDQTIRNLFYHVPMWFSMFLLLLGSWVYSIKYLNTMKVEYHRWAYALGVAGTLAGFSGIFTGMLWASSTWGTPWTRDPKLNGAAVGLLIYIAYWLLNRSITDPVKLRKIAAIYNIFVYPVFIALIWIIPKLSDFSIHPGSGDTVGFNEYDLNHNMRFVFYPAIIAWSMLFVWIASLKVRIDKIESEQINKPIE